MLTPLLLFLPSSGVCRADQGAERLQGAAAGEGGGDLRAQSREEQHQGEDGDALAHHDLLFQPDAFFFISSPSSSLDFPNFSLKFPSFPLKIVMSAAKTPPKK